MYPRYWRYRAVRAIPWPGGGFELSRQLRLGTYLCIVPRLRALPSLRSLPSDVNHPPPCRHRSVAVAGMCRRVTTNLVTASDSVPASRSICPPTFYVFTALRPAILTLPRTEYVGTYDVPLRVLQG